jgi:hypothetical protein
LDGVVAVVTGAGKEEIDPLSMNPMKKGLRLAGETPAVIDEGGPRDVVRRIGSQSQAS